MSSLLERYDSIIAATDHQEIIASLAAFEGSSEEKIAATIEAAGEGAQRSNQRAAMLEELELEGALAGARDALVAITRSEQENFAKLAQLVAEEPSSGQVRRLEIARVGAEAANRRAAQARRTLRKQIKRARV